MLRAARDLTKGLGEAKPAIYWPDMLASALVGYSGIALAILTDSLVVAIVAGLVASLALYRALMFIHELTHIPRRPARFPARLESDGRHPAADAEFHV